ncbi:MAG: EAL domain-containing protein [Alphaproteobacteria bacterium]|nr:EAL domain-containing protein [Alphaproteobacteria bacterium]
MQPGPLAGGRLEAFLEEAAPDRLSNLSFEFRQANIVENFDEFQVARGLIKAKGCSIVVDQIFPQTVGLVDLEYIGASMAKIHWRTGSEDILKERKRAIKYMMECNVVPIFVRVDQPRAFEVAADMGITMFQGFLIDEMLKKGGWGATPLLLVAEAPQGAFIFCSRPTMMRPDYFHAHPHQTFSAAPGDLCSAAGGADLARPARDRHAGTNHRRSRQVGGRDLDRSPASAGGRLQLGRAGRPPATGGIGVACASGGSRASIGTARAGRSRGATDLSRDRLRG